MGFFEVAARRDAGGDHVKEEVMKDVRKVSGFVSGKFWNTTTGRRVERISSSGRKFRVFMGRVNSLAGKRRKKNNLCVGDGCDNKKLKGQMRLACANKACQKVELEILSSSADYAD